MDKKLIICPTANMCNGFRAISSLLVYTEKIGYIYWENKYVY